MRIKKRGAALIGVSLLAAAAMLLSSALIADRDTAQTVSLIIIAVWFIPFTYLTTRGGPRDEDEQKEPGE